MKKNDFLEKLERKLSLLSVKDKDEIISYYDELISDKLESGLNEEEVIKKIGTIDEIVVQALITNTEFEGSKKKGSVIKKLKEPMMTMPRWVFVVIVCTSPIWVTIVAALGIALFSLVIALTSAFIALLMTIILVPLALMLGFLVTGPLTILLGLLNMIVFQSFYLGLFYLGLGVAILGLGIILTPLAINLIKITLKGVKALTNSLYVKYRTFISKRKRVVLNEN